MIFIFSLFSNILDYILSMANNRSNIAVIITSLLGFGLFSMFSSLQGNDVTQYGTAKWLTYGWIVGYAILAILCFYNCFRRLPSRVFLALSILTFGLAVFRATQIDFSQPIFCFIAPEEFAKRYPAGNETGGLIIMTLWLLLMWYMNKRNERVS